MRRPAVFFDRDNTLIVGSDYLGDPAKVVLVAGAAAAVARCRAMGFAVVVVSNQSGVGRGYFDESAVNAVNARLDALLLEHHGGAVIDRHEYCPFHPDAAVEAYRQESPRRKPRPGMITDAADAMALDLDKSWVVGDAPRDVAAGRGAGCRTVLIDDKSLVPSPAAAEPSTADPDFVAGSLIEAVEIIAGHQNAPKWTANPASSAAKATLAPKEKTINENDAPRTPARRSSATTTRNAPDAPAEKVSPDAPSSATANRPATSTVNRPAVTPVGETADRPNSVVRRDEPAGERPGVDPKKAQPAGASVTSASVVKLSSPVGAVAVPSTPRPPTTSPASLARLEAINQQVLLELKKLNESRHDDFSSSKLIAGIMQVLALAAVLPAYFLYRNDVQTLQSWLLVAVFLQLFTIALLIMSRQR